MYFIDVQGTLIDDLRRQPVPGAVAFIDRLNRAKVPYLVVTNNTKHSSRAFLDHLRQIGFRIPDTHYLDALMMLEQKVARGNIAAYGSEIFLQQVARLGYTLDYHVPETVLVSVRADYASEDFAQMIGFLMRGARLVGMHDTTLYVKNAKRYPGAGAVIRLLSYAAGVPFSVVGKPSKAFYDEALRRLRLQSPDAMFSSVTMISDDYAGDLTGAGELGMKTVLVLSGKVRPDDALVQRLRSEESGVVVYNDVSEITSVKSMM